MRVNPSRNRSEKGLLNMNKKNLNNPPRLLESKDLGPLLQEATAVSFDAHRLEKNRAAILFRTAALSRLSSGGRRFSLFNRRPLAWIAAAFLLFMSAGAAAVIYMHVADNMLSAAGDTFSETGEKKGTNNKRRNAETSSVPDLQSPSEPTADILVTEREMDAGILPTQADPGKPRPVADKSSVDVSTLDEQVRIFNNAKVLLDSGEFESAVQQLHKLKQRYPSGPLSLEADELKARGLAGLHRYEAASRTVETLIRAKIPTRKKAQLYRFLGDLQVKQNQCDNALESFRLALGLGLTGADLTAAKAGIRKCVP